MNATEKYYWKYIKKIAKRSSHLRIKRHLIKHVQELIPNNKKGKLKNGDRLPLSWMVSMQNLLDTYAIINNIKSTKEIGIYKMIYRYYGNKKLYTSPPKISKLVKIKIVPLRNKEMEHTKKQNREILINYKNNIK